jgi:tetratricopeptide (TPR) repeat protein
MITVKAQRAGGAVRNLSELGLLQRLQTAVISYTSYLGKLLWPTRLIALYPYPNKPYHAWQIVGAVLLMAAISAWVIASRGRPYQTMGWLWFVGSLVPMIGLVQVGGQAMADRYAYIPFIGLFVMLVWVTADFARAANIRAPILALPAVACLLSLSVLTYKQVSYWHDTESFWLRTLALTQDNYIAQDELGDFLLAQDRNDEAAQHFRAALAVRHDDLPASLNLGAYAQGHGNLPAAISLYETVAQHALDIELRATAYGNLGSAYRQAGQLGAAKQCYDTALQLTPKRTMAMIGLGLMAQSNGDLTEAVRQYSRAMAMQPTDVGFLLLAQALQHQGKIDEAKAIYERVARLSPDLAAARRVEESLLAGK